MNLTILFFFSFLISFVGSWAIKSYGHKFDMIDIPSDRSSHEKIIPKGGGLGILCSFILSGFYLKIYLFFIIPSVILSLASFIGDRVDIKPRIRLLIQFFCSIFFLLGFNFNLGSEIVIITTLLPFSIFIVGTSNFYNFMDGINGIAGIIGFVGFTFLGIYGFLNEVQIEYAYLSIFVSISCLGFLPLNIPIAKVFMGDVGSILLGFIYSCLTIIISKSALDFFSLCGFLYLFFVDVLTTMAIRLKDGEALNKPHRRHLYQLFANELGIEHWKISLTFGIIQLLICCLVLFIKNYGLFYLIILYFLLFFIFINISLYIRNYIRSNNSKS